MWCRGRGARPSRRTAGSTRQPNERTTAPAEHERCFVEARDHRRSCAFGGRRQRPAQGHHRRSDGAHTSARVDDTPGPSAARVNVCAHLFNSTLAPSKSRVPRPELVQSRYARSPTRERLPPPTAGAVASCRAPSRTRSSSLSLPSAPRVARAATTSPHPRPPATTALRTPRVMRRQPARPRRHRRHRALSQRAQRPLRRRPRARAPSPPQRRFTCARRRR